MRSARSTASTPPSNVTPNSACESEEIEPVTSGCDTATSAAATSPMASPSRSPRPTARPVRTASAAASGTSAAPASAPASRDARTPPNGQTSGTETSEAAGSQTSNAGRGRAIPFATAGVR